MKKPVEQHVNNNFPVPLDFRTSANRGTSEFTGLLIIRNVESGQCFEQSPAKSETICALVLNKSSRLIPGFLGIPCNGKCDGPEKR